MHVMNEMEQEKISIHSPHARGDHHFIKRYMLDMTISIHSPHARGDVHLCYKTEN